MSPRGLCVQVVIAPNGWSAKAALLVCRPETQEPVIGHDGQSAVLNIKLKVSWTQEVDVAWQAERERERVERERLKNEERARLRQEEAMQEEAERAERIAAKKRPGPTFFGGGRLGNAVEVEAAAKQGENWSKQNAIVVNSNKRTEAQLRALAAAETRRLGNSGRLADKQRAAVLHSALADGNALGRAMQESGFMTYDACRRETIANAAVRRQQAKNSRSNDAAASCAGSGLPAKGCLPVRIPPSRSAQQPAERAPRSGSLQVCQSQPVTVRQGHYDYEQASQPPTKHLPHREGLLCANDLDRYASLNASHADGHGAPSSASGVRSRAWGSEDLEGIWSAATAINSSSFITSPRAAPIHAGKRQPAGAMAYHDATPSRDDDGDDLLARARALIAAGAAVSGALGGVGRLGAGGEESRPRESMFASQIRLEERDSSPYSWRGNGDGPEGPGTDGEGGGEDELDRLAKIRGIARAILSGSNEAAVPADETGMEQTTQIVDEETFCADDFIGQTSFGTRIAEMDRLGAARGKQARDDGSDGGWPWMGEVERAQSGGGLVEPSTATLPSVQSRAESDLSAGIPIAGRGGSGRGHRSRGGWGAPEEEDDGREQRVVLQGMRLRGSLCGREDNPEISFMLKIDMGGFKCRTDKERRLRGEVSWKDRCELDLVGATSTLRVRVVRCRQPRGASQSVDSVVGECEIPVDQLEGSDRAVSWGWHRVLGLARGGDAAGSGEIHLGIERFRVAAEDDADVPEKESKATMPDEVLAPDLEDPFSKAGASVVLQRSWRCHLARRATRATIQWRESLQRKSHRAFPGSLGSLAGALGKGKDAKGNTTDEGEFPREGAAAMYSRRRPAVARGLPFGMPNGAGDTGGGFGRDVRASGADAVRASTRLSTDMGIGFESPFSGGMGGVHGNDPGRGGLGSQGRNFPLDALFPLSKASKSAFRLPPPAGITDARGGGGAAERSWGGGGEGHGGLYGGNAGYAGVDSGYSRAEPSNMLSGRRSDLGEQWDKIHGAAALLLG